MSGFDLTFGWTMYTVTCEYNLRAYLWIFYLKIKKKKILDYWNIFLEGHYKKKMFTFVCQIIYLIFFLSLCVCGVSPLIVKSLTIEWKYFDCFKEYRPCTNLEGKKKRKFLYNAGFQKKLKIKVLIFSSFFVFVDCSLFFFSFFFFFPSLFVFIFFQSLVFLSLQ